jgi:hypothetical protein
MIILMFMGCVFFEVQSEYLNIIKKALCLRVYVGVLVTANGRELSYVPAQLNATYDNTVAYN